MRARFVRLAAALQALLLMSALVLPGLASATELFTDLWVYQDGDTVNVTGIDYGANEVIDFVTVDPVGTVVDVGTATSDASGDVAYSFVLHVTVEGIYTTTGVGQTSGFSASVDFDPASITYNDLGSNVTWKNNGSTITFSGTFTCAAGSGAGGPCSSVTGINVAVVADNSASGVAAGSAFSFNLGAGDTPAAFPVAASAGSKNWSATRTIGTGLPLADGRYEIRVTLNYLDGSTALTKLAESANAGGNPAEFGVDNVAPTITGTVTPLLPANPPWYNLSQAAASLSWNCSDALSGVGTASPSICPAGATIPNGANQTFVGTVQDRAGNSTTATVSGVYVDRANPTISNTISPASPAASGWYNFSTGAPTVTFTCGDTGSSGLASCTPPVLMGQGEDQIATGTATDVAGNSATSTRTNIDVDTVGPTSTINNPTVGETGITVTGTSSDATSGPDTMLIRLYAGPCFSGSPIDTETVNVGGSGNWSATLTGGGYSTPGTFCLLRTPTDNAGNVGGTNGSEYVADAAPSVLATSPMDGATNVLAGANIAVTFSENVTVDLGPHWFTIQCGATAFTGTTTGSGTATVVFDPSVNLPNSTLCTVTIRGSSVHDTDLNDPPDTFTPNYVFSFTTVSANTAPVLTVPAGPVTAEATSSAGATVTFAVTATDAEDEPDPTPTCDWDSGDVFPVGTTTVTCSVTDSGGLGDTEAFDVVVGDSTDPVVSITTNEDDNGFGWFNIASNDAFPGVTIDISVDDAVGATSLSCTINGEAIAGPLDPAGDSFPIGDGVNTIFCEASDAAGNGGDDTELFQVDQTAPSTSVELDREPAASGWFNIATGAPIAEFACLDATSGVASCPADFPFPDGENQSHGGTALDVAGNGTTASVTNVDVDTVAPAVTVTAARAADHEGWYNAPVSFNTAGTDATSGILDANCTADQSYTGPDGTGLVVNGTCTDNAGNPGNGSSAAFDFDDTNPTITPSIAPPASGTGWWNIATGAPTVSYDCSDATSGIDSCEGPHLFGEGADQSHTGTAVDAAGNTNSASVSDIDVDLTAPAVTLTAARAADHNGWYNAPVAFDTAGTDATSGVLDANCTADQGYTGPDGTGLVVTGSCTDNAGNPGNGSSAAFDFDDTNPSATTTLGRGPDFGDWYNQPVGWTTTGTDATSGIDACDSGTYSGPDSATASVTGSCIDVAGNSSAPSTAPFKYDATDPTITFLSRAPAANGFGWNNAAVTVTWTCGDATSGAASATVSDTKSAEGADQVADGTCGDNAGNSAGASLGNIDIDLTDPTVSLAGGPANGASYYFGSVPDAPTCNASDALSGLAGACSVSGYATTVGTHTVTATATDKADNSNAASSTYTVLAWTLTGFYAPVDMGLTYNLVKGGSTVPLKFEAFAGSTELVTVASIKGFKATETACGAFTFMSADEIEITSTGGTTLRYDSTGGQFIQNWQTPKNKVGTCWVVTMTTQDGSSLNAFFKLK